MVGHRGFGMNRTPGRGIRENTVASFIAAHGSGAGWCEFDVQVTADGVPVLFHDNLLLVRYGFGDVQALSIRELDLAELKAMSRAAIATAKAAAAGAPDAVAAVRGLDAPRNDTDADARASRAAPPRRRRRAKARATRSTRTRTREARTTRTREARSWTWWCFTVSSRDTPKPSRCPG